MMRFQAATGLAALLMLNAACSAAPQSAPAATTERPFATQMVAEFDDPWAMTFLPGSGLPLTNQALVTEKGGKLWLVDVGTGKRQEVAGVPRTLRVEGQGGLGDVVAAPDFAGTERVYLSYVEPDGERSGAVVAVGRLVLGQGAPRLEGLQVIWRQQPKVTGAGHFSHRIAFGEDGKLFISSGDRQKFEPAQDMAGNLGKIIRLNPDGSVPADNPFAARGGVASQVWTLGHRNVLALAFAPDGRLWESEMGPAGGDEINLIERGKNYGWPVVSNGDHYDGRPIPDHPTRPDFEAPKVWWNPSISPGGMIVYTGDLFPQWKGDLLQGALSGEALIRVDVDGATAKKAEQWGMNARIREVEQGPGGEVYLLQDEGQLVRLTPTQARR